MNDKISEEMKLLDELEKKRKKMKVRQLEDIIVIDKKIEELRYKIWDDIYEYVTSDSETSEIK